MKKYLLLYQKIAFATPKIRVHIIFHSTRHLTVTQHALTLWVYVLQYVNMILEQQMDSMYVCMYVCMYACYVYMYVCMYRCIYMYVYMYT